uniref:T-box domain-containing protein n=1 Tax=Setaria digitata TaxID=48799 RepID=A0A915Q0Q3_9BILA
MNEILVIQREESNEKIRIGISHRKLWEEFHRNNNEMILTSKGRCIYPRIGYTVEGLEPKTMYLVCLKLSQTDHSRYKYSAGEWHTASTGDPESEARCIYPDNGSTHIGQYWINNGIRFGKLKITNSAKDCSSNVLLTSMHKYRPVLYIYKVYTTPALCLDGSTILTNQYQLVKTFSDQIMEFIAVTAYQNQRIIEMKKIHNSYARGQRGGTIKGLQNPPATIEHCSFLNSSSFARLNLPNMWNYSTLWHHFPVPYPSFVPRSSQ